MAEEGTTTTGWLVPRVAAAAAMSAVFLGLAIASSVLVAAAVTVPLSIVLGSRRERRAPRAVAAHALSTPAFPAAAQVRATRASSAAAGSVTAA